VQSSGNLPVPLHLRNAPTKLMKELDYGKNYKYAHAFEGNFVYQEFLPEEISKKAFFEPSNNANEHKIREKMKVLWGEKYGY
jgi:putative ATPase